MRGLPSITWETDESWHKTLEPVYVPLFGRKLAVTVHREADTATEFQLQALAQILAIPKGATTNLTHRLALECWRSYSDETEIQVRDEVWNHVEVTDLLVPKHAKSQDRYCFVSGECDWDPEHGFDLLYKNGELFEVGQQRGLALNEEWQLYYISE